MTEERHLEVGAEDGPSLNSSIKIMQIYFRLKKPKQQLVKSRRNDSVPDRRRPFLTRTVNFSSTENDTVIVVVLSFHYLINN